MSIRSHLPILLTLLALLVVSTGCPTGRDRGGGDDDDGADDDDSSAADDDDVADDDDAVDDDDQVDDDDGAGAELVYASGSYRWFYDLADSLNNSGFADCYKYWDVEATTGSPNDECPGCTHVMRVDFVWNSGDCDPALGDLAAAEPDFPNVELGLAGGSLYQYDGSNWASFMTGDGEGNSWSGESEGQDSGQYVRYQQIDITWE